VFARAKTGGAAAGALLPAAAAMGILQGGTAHARRSRERSAFVSGKFMGKLSADV
jgi:hypothetical protein